MAGYPSSEGRKLVLALVQVIEKNKTYLSEIDGKIGDGDHGINMAKGFALVKTKLGEREVVVSEGLGLIGQTLLTEIGGSIGPLYGTFFLQMSLRAKDKPQIDETTFGEMLRAARAGLEELGGAKVGDKTCWRSFQSDHLANDGNHLGKSSLVTERFSSSCCGDK